MGMTTWGLTERQAAERLQVHRATLQRWRLGGQVPHQAYWHTPTGAIRYRAPELDEWWTRGAQRIPGDQAQEQQQEELADQGSRSTRGDVQPSPPG
jgi:predicted site-specific integrase-resolvase